MITIAGGVALVIARLNESDDVPVGGFHEFVSDVSGVHSTSVLRGIRRAVDLKQLIERTGRYGSTYAYSVNPDNPEAVALADADEILLCDNTVSRGELRAVVDEKLAADVRNLRLEVAINGLHPS
jgi:hypothetical protein